MACGQHLETEVTTQLTICSSERSALAVSLDVAALHTVRLTHQVCSHSEGSNIWSMPTGICGIKPCISLTFKPRILINVLIQLYVSEKSRKHHKHVAVKLLYYSQISLLQKQYQSIKLHRISEGLRTFQERLSPWLSLG